MEVDRTASVLNDAGLVRSSDVTRFSTRQNSRRGSAIPVTYCRMTLVDKAALVSLFGL